MSNPEYYKDKICIVTGANSGIGYAVSEELLKRGAIVYMAGRNPDKVSKAAQKLSKFKDRVHTIIVDVTVQEQVENAINNTVAELVGWIYYLTMPGWVELCSLRLHHGRLEKHNRCQSVECYLRCAHCSAHHAKTGLRTYH
nr:SDR family NAD(P)-dependent oxidoreductase [Methanobacterium formicicum]